MSVISRLLQTASGAPKPADPNDAGQAAPASGADAPAAAAQQLEAGPPLYALAGLDGGNDSAQHLSHAQAEMQRAAQQRVAQLLDSGALGLAELRSHAHNTAALLAVLSLCTDATLLPQALAAIDDQELLGRLAIGGSTPLLRRLAAERVHDAATLARLSKDARGKDKNVYRVVKQKRDALQAQRRAAADQLAAMQTLCTSIERHILQPVNSAYVLAVDHLDAQWQAVAGDAPPELVARAEAALARSRHLIARQQQQIAHELARVAAIANAPPERRQILEALQAILAELYGAHLEDPGAALAAHAARWQELSRLNAPGEYELARYHQLGEAIAALHAELLRHGTMAEQCAAMDEQRSHSVRRALSHVALLGEQVPAGASAASAALDEWEQARARAQAAAAAALHQVTALLRRAQNSLAAGHSRQAAGMRRALEGKLAAMGKLPPQLTAQLQSLDAKLEVLQDWRQFVVAPKRTELIEQMEALVGSGERPRVLAERIKSLQDEWKLISKGGTEDTQAEWQRFHAAAQAAYEPCKEFFAAQAAQRAANLEHRRALLQRLEAFSARVQEAPPDWREVARALRESAQQWRALQPVERAANKPLQEAFDALSAALQARLNGEYTSNAQAKRELIARAQQLATATDGRQAAEEVKRLQQAWQQVGLVAQDESQRLWEEFRQHCDAVFAHRQQQHSEQQTALAASSAQAVALCEEAEQLLALEGAGLVAGLKGVPALRERFDALGELPFASARALRGRFETALERCQHKVAQARVREKQQAWEHVLEAGNLIRQYRLGLASGGDAETIEARRLDAANYLEAERAWPKGALQALRAELARSTAADAPSGDVGANEAALRLLCIRAELLTDSATPEADQPLRREYQLQQLLKGLGQAQAEGAQAFESLVYEWLAVGASSDGVYAQLLERFNACRRRVRSEPRTEPRAEQRGAQRAERHGDGRNDRRGDFRPGQRADQRGDPRGNPRGDSRGNPRGDPRGDRRNEPPRRRH